MGPGPGVGVGVVEVKIEDVVVAVMMTDDSDVVAGRRERFR